MKSRSTIIQLALVAVALATSAIPASASQYTTTCGTGQYDMLSLMFMQDSYTAVNYYVYGDAYTWNGTAWVLNSSPRVEHTDVVDVTTSHDNGTIWDTGKFNSVKDYQGVPNGTYGGAATRHFGDIHGTSTCSTTTMFTYGLLRTIGGMLIPTKHSITGRVTTR